MPESYAIVLLSFRVSLGNNRGDDGAGLPKAEYRYVLYAGEHLWAPELLDCCHFEVMKASIAARCTCISATYTTASRTTESFSYCPSDRRAVTFEQQSCQRNCDCPRSCHVVREEADELRIGRCRVPISRSSCSCLLHMKLILQMRETASFPDAGVLTSLGLLG
ncbi:hypothetical protein AUEXF2481DRAFT_42981 [Aureobasidium subglaciale EXF-2481]|uniref:Uncharacterized protein n=1 Tax=Aureobasidium subglaciale (strain EXF-2481) TaxID=1043005 RepID=A0A074Y983_AURSE|nr:uncharacterized protein AUEXF2481DRAFT_42981 [Aureobasidium subglaciale EXF-2481]KEQ92539.1 hypothetical protein AUEXF2481DRAFT_42981 [Aureobasidium subglaciale EXF-2481]